MLSKMLQQAGIDKCYRVLNNRIQQAGIDRSKNLVHNIPKSDRAIQCGQVSPNELMKKRKKSKNIEMTHLGTRGVQELYAVPNNSRSPSDFVLRRALAKPLAIQEKSKDSTLEHSKMKGHHHRILHCSRHLKHVKPKCKATLGLSSNGAGLRGGDTTEFGNGKVSWNSRVA